MTDDATARTVLAHRRTALSMGAACLLIVRLAALRPWWASLVADPICLTVAAVAFRSERQQIRTKQLTTQMVLLGVVAAMILLVPRS